MQGKKLWVGCISLLLLALLVMPLAGGGYYAKAAAGLRILKIGTVMPISGPLGVIGLTWGRGFNLCADWLNEQGGLKVGGDR